MASSSSLVPLIERAFTSNGSNDSVVSGSVVGDDDEALVDLAEHLLENYDGGFDNMSDTLINFLNACKNVFSSVLSSKKEMELKFLLVERRLRSLSKQQQQQQQQQRSDSSEVGSPTTARSVPPPKSKDKEHVVSEFVDPDAVKHLTDIYADAKEMAALPEEYNGRFAQRGREKLTESVREVISIIPVDSQVRSTLNSQIRTSPDNSIKSVKKFASKLMYAIELILEGSRVAQTECGGQRRKSFNAMMNRGKNDNFVDHGDDDRGIDHNNSQRRHGSSGLEGDFLDLLTAPRYADGPLGPLSDSFFAALEKERKTGAAKLRTLEEKVAEMKGEELVIKMQGEDEVSRLLRKADEDKKKLKARIIHLERELQIAANNSSHGMNRVDSTSSLSGHVRRSTLPGISLSGSSQKSEKTPFLRSPAISKAKKHLKETLFQCYASSPKGGQGLGKHLSEVTSSTRSTSTDSNSQTRLSPMTARRLSPQVADL